MDGLLQKIRAGHIRAVAQAITLVEQDGVAADALLSALPGEIDPAAHVVGLTGPPGAGKSSLTDHLIAAYRSMGHKVAVIAVDPSSPFTGGAVLGDRVRMNRHALDPDVFIRSMGTRGSLGGLARPVRAASRILEAAGYRHILLETVGVGQSELDVMHVADTVVVMVTPAGGDQVQAAKAGIMEIGDVFVVHKADLPGAQKTAQTLRDMLHLRPSTDEGYVTPVLLASSQKGSGMDDIVAALTVHWEYLLAFGGLQRRRGRGRIQEAKERMMVGMVQALRQRFTADAALQTLLARVEAMELTPGEAAAAVIEKYFPSHAPGQANID